MNVDLQTLRDLEARLSKATGPDRELDARLNCALTWDSEFGRWPSDIAGNYQLKYDDYRWNAAHYTSSIDAAVALCERVLPGWRIRWQSDGDGVHESFVEGKGDFNAIDAGPTQSFASNAALALCLAIVRALISRAEQEQAPL